MRAFGAVSAVIALLAGGCMGQAPVGTVAAPGATPNAVLNSPVATGAGEAPLGVVEGGLLGADIGRSLNDADRGVALKAEFEALEYGRQGRGVRWQGPSGARGEVTVGPTYEVNLLDCREYTHTIHIGGRPRVAKGTACRQPEGRWNIIR